LSPLEEKTEAVPGADGDQMIREVFLLCTSCTRTVQIQIHSANRACQMGFHTSTRQCVQKIVAVSVLDHGDVGFHIGRNRVVCLPVAAEGGEDSDANTAVMTKDWRAGRHPTGGRT
jgi:hypothetical protein